MALMTSLVGIVVVNGKSIGERLWGEFFKCIGKVCIPSLIIHEKRLSFSY